MPTLSSRPELLEETESELTPDEIVEIIADSVTYSAPSGPHELKMILDATCRTLWNVGTIEDFFLYDSNSGGYEVGFRVSGDLSFHLVQIN